MPATKATVRLTMAPTMAAVRANRSRSGLSTWVSDAVWPGEARMAVKADSTPASVQATRRGPPDPDPRQPGRVGVLGHGPHGQSPRGQLDEGGQGDGHDRGHDQGQHLARREEVGRRWGRTGAMGTGKGLDRFLGRMKGRAVKTNSTWRKPDGGHHHQHPGPVEQPPQQSSLRAPTAAARTSGQHQREPVVEPEVVVALDQEDGRHHPELALGEVEHPVGPVDEDQAQGQQAVAEAGDDPLDEDETRDRHGVRSARARSPALGQEHRPQQVGRARAARRSGPSKRTSPRSMKKARSARLMARFTLCSTRITVVPCGVDLAHDGHQPVDGLGGQPEGQLVDHQQLRARSS